MFVSAWAFAFRPGFLAVQNARFSYGPCTPTLERGLAPKCSQHGGHIDRTYARFSFDRAPFPAARQNQNPCTPPMMRKQGREQRGPARPRTGAAPCGRSFPARFWFTLSGGAGDAPSTKPTEKGERFDPDTQGPARPGDPSAAARTPLPTSRRRVQKCTFHVGALHVRAVAPLYKNARFRHETCTPRPEPARKSRCSQCTSRRGPVSPVSKPLQLWNSPESGRGTKMYASPNPCTPQRHRGGCPRRRGLKDPSRMKAPTRPVLKDRSWVNSLTGGYAGGLDCSHSQTALAKVLTNQTKGRRLDPDTQDPARPEVSAPVPCAGVNADRQKCHF